MKVHHVECARRNSGVSLKACLLSVLISLGATGSQSLPLPVVEAPIPGDPVMVEGGLIAGKVLASGVRAYLGVPYAAAPLRENRWRAPQPVIPWSGTYNADSYPAACMQTMRGSTINHFFGNEAISEDCLYLNIWAPEDQSAENLPVVVWIYGGAFNVGSSAMRNYSGEFLAEKGVIYVSMNYRVGIFGYMGHPELTEETDYQSSGNYGFLDQIAALEWVQGNIEAFGGDPDNVMLVGQSAGSMSISVLQASPLAAGLFTKAFGMSGSLLADGSFGSFASTETLEQAGLEFQNVLNADSLEQMRTLAPDVIFNTARSSRIAAGPSIDGYVLPERPRTIFANGEQNDVALVLGYTRDESFSPLGGAQDLSTYRSMVTAMYPGFAESLLNAYPASSDDEVRRAATDMGRDASMGAAQWTWASLQSQTGTEPVYAYFFTKVHPYTPGIEFPDHNPETAGAYHTGEVPYFLQTMDYYNLFRQTRDWTGYDRQLAESMSDALVAFAKTGDPGAAGLVWPEFQPDDPRMLEFGEEIRVIDWPHAAEIEIFTNTASQPIQRTPAAGGARD